MREQIVKLGREFFGDGPTHDGPHSIDFWVGNLFDRTKENDTSEDRQEKAKEVAPIFRDFLLERGITAKVEPRWTFVAIKWRE